MPNRYDSMAEQAHQLQTLVSRLGEELSRRDFSTAQPAITGISKLAHQLERDIYEARQDLGDAPGEAPNPYRQIHVPGPTIQDGLAVLPVEDLLEYCRYENWHRRHHAAPYGRWWLSKHIAIGERTLVDRGLARDAWMDGTEQEDE